MLVQRNEAREERKIIVQMCKSVMAMEPVNNKPAPAPAPAPAPQASQHAGLGELQVNPIG